MFFNNSSASGNQQRGTSGGRGCGSFNGQSFEGQLPHWAAKFTGRHHHGKVPANIEETDTAYILHLYAAGIKKEHLSVSVNNSILKVAYTAPPVAAVKFVHNEFSPSGFERLFQLNDTVVASNLSASYVDGIISITLPKNPETFKPAQEIIVQ